MKQGKIATGIQGFLGLFLIGICLKVYSFYIIKFSGKDQGFISSINELSKSDYWISSSIILLIFLFAVISIVLIIFEWIDISKEEKFLENTQSLTFKNHTLEELKIPDNNLTIHNIDFSYVPAHTETLKFFVGAFFIGGLLGSFIGIGETVAGAVSQLDISSGSEILKKITPTLSKLQIVFGVSISGLLTALTVENFQQIIFRKIYYLEWIVTSQVKNESIDLLKNKRSLSDDIQDLKKVIVETKEEQSKLLNNLFVIKNEDNTETLPANILRDLLRESTKQTTSFKNFNTDLADGLNISEQTLSTFKEFQNQIFKDYFVFRMEDNNDVLPSEFFKNLHNNSNQQTKALKSFSTDLADSLKISTETIVGFLGEQFVDILNRPFKNHLTPALDKIEVAVQQLKQTKEESSGAIIEKVIGDLQNSLKDMGSQFQQSLSGSATSQLENLATVLSQSSQAFESLPQQINSMMNVLEEQVNNTKSILDTSLEAAKQTSQTQVEQTQQVFGDLLVQLREGVGSQQKVVEFITNKMGENAQIATKVMSEHVQNTAKNFSDTISSLQDNMKSVIETQSEKALFVNDLIEKSKEIFERGNTLSSQINSSIDAMSSVLKDISQASGVMLENTKVFESSGNTLKDTSTQFRQQSNEFLSANQKTLIELGNSLKQAQVTATDYSNKFNVIQNGLSGIFSEIQNGLSNYQTVTSKSLNQYLGQFSDQLGKATSSLSSSISSLSEIIEEVVDIGEKISDRR